MASYFESKLDAKADKTSAVIELAELAELIEELPEEYKDRFVKAFNRAAGNIERRRRILSFIQEALSQLRLDMKYLLFDLDATRKERDDYRRQLEESR